MMKNFQSINDITLNYPFDLMSGIFLFLIVILLSQIISKKIIFIKDNNLNFVSSYVILISFLSIGNE